MKKESESLFIENVKGDATRIEVSLKRVNRHTAGAEFVLHKADGTKSTFSIHSIEDVLDMARFLEVGLASPEDMEMHKENYQETGRVLKVMSGSTVIKTYTDMEGVCDANLGNLNYPAIAKALPEYATSDFYFVVYNTRFCMQDEKVDAVIMSCIKKQLEVIVSGDLRVSRPMTQKDIAKLSGTTITYVSRSVKGARVFTTHRNYTLESGMDSLAYPSLFNEGIEDIDGNVISTLGIKQKVLALIENEDKAKPITDDKISKELCKYGYRIARRTVAKYRGKVLGIPATHQRKVR